MSGLALLLIAAAVLAAGCLLYGRWLLKAWGADASGQEPKGRLAALARQASSSCAPGAVAGPVAAVAFGWLPALLWIVLGGVLVGAAQDLAALCAATRSGGRSLSQLADSHVGPGARRLLLLFVWLFSIVVAAVFSDLAASALVASPSFSSTGVMDEATFAGGAAATACVLLVVSAGVLGYLSRRAGLGGAAKAAVAVCLVALSLFIGMELPVVSTERGFWDFVLAVYLLFACCARPESIKRPGELVCFALLAAVLVLAVLGIVVGGPALDAAPFEGFAPEGAGMLFPALFATLSCGAVSGFHALVATDGASSGDGEASASGRGLLSAGCGAVLLEGLLAVCAVICVCSFSGDAAGFGSPLALFSASVASLLEAVGLPASLSQVVLTASLVALAVCSLDATVRIGAASVRELVLDGRPEPGRARRFLANRYTAALLVLVPAYVAALGGYEGAWALFGSSNELLAALMLALLALCLKASGRRGAVLVVPACLMLAVSAVALVEVAAGLVPAFGADALSGWRQAARLAMSALMLVLGCLVAAACLKKGAGDASKPGGAAAAGPAHAAR